MAVSPVIKRLIDGSPNDLPVFHPIALRLLCLLETEFSYTDVIELASEDTVISGKILQLANSPLYRGKVPTETIKDAVIRLGSQQVAKIAVAASQNGLHKSSNTTINECLIALWLHSHGCALGASWVAMQTGRQRLSDRAFIGGLLHDVGKLYILKALERLNEKNVALKVIEEAALVDIFDEMHVDRGIEVMKEWNLPPLYKKIATHHHEEEYRTDDEVFLLVRFLDRICNAIGVGPGRQVSVDLVNLPENEVFKLSKEQMDDLVDLLNSPEIAQPFVAEEPRRGDRTFEIEKRLFNLGWILHLYHCGVEIETRPFGRGDYSYQRAEFEGKQWCGDEAASQDVA